MLEFAQRNLKGCTTASSNSFMTAISHSQCRKSHACADAAAQHRFAFFQEVWNGRHRLRRARTHCCNIATTAPTPCCSLFPLEQNLARKHSPSEYLVRGIICPWCLGKNIEHKLLLRLWNFDILTNFVADLDSKRWLQFKLQSRKIYKGLKLVSYSLGFGGYWEPCH